ncbi:Chitin synthase, class 3 [Puccinia graminis f. sp. tritici]|uniref:Chitin synthase, class 3 n=1 Tax=Puccinia graminis f. sp. tritici TaxID=56615 RepID=A0A5B0NED6_PUCGR|nr:Chitin synthase, class 3 [Puccinia graminis f. sp. tritici]
MSTPHNHPHNRPQRQQPPLSSPFVSQTDLRPPRTAPLIHQNPAYNAYPDDRESNLEKDEGSYSPLTSIPLNRSYIQPLEITSIRRSFRSGSVDRHGSRDERGRVEVSHTGATAFDGSAALAQQPFDPHAHPLEEHSPNSNSPGPMNTTHSRAGLMAALGRPALRPVMLVLLAKREALARLLLVA